jgi:cobalamin biosynthesis protein CobD/CbiB
MAGALGVVLEKRGHYRLGDGPPPDPAAIDRAMRVARWTGAGLRPWRRSSWRGG